MQAIIKGRPEGREVSGPKNTIITTYIITKKNKKLVPQKTRIPIYVGMRLPSGAPIKRDNMSSDTGRFWEGQTRAGTAGRVFLHQKAGAGWDNRRSHN